MGSSAYTFVNNEKSLVSIIDSICSLASSPPSLCIDLQGVNMCRLSTVSLVTVFVHPKNHRNFPSITTLSHVAFTTAGNHSVTLKDTLENHAITKRLFNVRIDSDALNAHFGIALQGTQDTQLMESACRCTSKPLLAGLKSCVEDDTPAALGEKRAWIQAKEKGSMSLAAGNGGHFQASDERLLPKELLQNAVQDVQLLPPFRDLYSKRLNKN